MDTNAIEYGGRLEETATSWHPPKPGFTWTNILRALTTPDLAIQGRFRVLPYAGWTGRQHITTARAGSPLPMAIPKSISGKASNTPRPACRERGYQPVSEMTGTGSRNVPAKGSTNLSNHLFVRSASFEALLFLSQTGFRRPKIPWYLEFGGSSL